MPSLYFQLFRQKFSQLPSSLSLAAISLLLLVVSSGCVQKAQEEVQLEIKNVQSVQSNGLYNISGSTNLPDSSQITVTAVRNLRPQEGQQLLNSPDSTNRSILARQIVEVKQGEWLADLNLWQVAANGTFQENWQASQVLTRLTPENGVTFIATFDAASQQQSQQSLKKPDQDYQNLEGKLIRFTNEGEIYVQASQTLAIPLPTGKTIAPRFQLEDMNDGWGIRNQIPPQPTIGVNTRASLLATKFRQTNASLKASEFMR
ncbi:hypothetical protein [Iningainema tapete]|uniref:Uncharacterized protein n=1 Tax=Iningainema tapete BLCC-T55 TaxID=2748662 RepID=A0A8J7C8L6_9CYAN|nr:hypothetical protein [Iningainema tapete]MBD2774841.1 hypothetical protein [Iningainema tapete BLCC-T55]